MLALRNMFAGGRIGVEKVKPDPLNLLAKTSVGSNVLKHMVFLRTIVHSDISLTWRCLFFWKRHRKKHK